MLVGWALVSWGDGIQALEILRLLRKKLSELFGKYDNFTFDFNEYRADLALVDISKSKFAVCLEWSSIENIVFQF